MQAGTDQPRRGHTRLEADLATASQQQAVLEPEQQELARAAAGRLLQQLKATKAVGRLVIPLQDILDGTVEDITLEDGDLLHIPDNREADNREACRSLQFAS